METLESDAPRSATGKKKKDEGDSMRSTASAMVIAGMTLFLVLFAWHSTWVTAEAYSSPSIVLAANQADGSRKIFDDFREAYYWLRQNTPENAKVCQAERRRAVSVE